MFGLADKGFGILAMPINNEGHMDGPGELLYFETNKFVHFEEKARMKLSEVTMVDYSCVLDAETLLYRVGWKEENGTTCFCTKRDFIDFDRSQLGEMFSVRHNTLP
ncbi:hypothetical protein [Metabacillus sp. FJAT-53654]|uniref:Uncharacterized protein n=1 Tax=Metabacillus rhizosphaerae TaxID=3117747 RepID=A0ABZ2MPJ6_9BACI